MRAVHKFNLADVTNMLRQVQRAQLLLMHQAHMPHPRVHIFTVHLC